MTDRQKVLDWFKKQEEDYCLVDVKLTFNDSKGHKEEQLYASLWYMIESIALGNYEVLAESI